MSDSFLESMELEGGFTVDFHFEYQRNNKGNGQKNLRCFPKCNETGHTNSSFCGQPVCCFVHGITLPDNSSSSSPFLQSDSLFCVGEFCRWKEDSEYAKGQVIEKSTIVQQIRTRENPISRFIDGECRMEDGRVDAVFNGELIGYHYGWASNKHSCEQEHVFRAHFFFQETGERDEEVRVKYIDFLDTPPFKLYSRRRTKPGRPPSGIELDRSKGMKRVSRYPSSGSAGSRHSKKSRMSESQLRDEDLNLFNSTQATQQHKEQENGREPSLYQSLMAGVKAVFTSSSAETTLESLDDFDVSSQWPSRSLLQQRLSELDEEMESNKTLDRLSHFIFQYGGASFGTRDKGTTKKSTLLTPNVDDPDDGMSLFGEDGLDNLLDIFDDGTDSNLFIPVPAAEEETDGTRIRGCSDACDATGLGSLRRMLLDNDVEDAESLLDGIRILSERAFAEVQTTNLFSKMAERWSTPEAILQLKEHIRTEQNMNFEWSPRRELETFRMGSSLEDSVFAELRQCYRDVMQSALRSLRFSTDMFAHVMELAAKHNVIMPDPFYPPDKHTAEMIHLQLYGDIKRAQVQDYGSKAGYFRNEQEQKDYAKDLLLLRRGVFRRLLCNRVIQEQKVKRALAEESFLSSGDAPVHPAWDVNGTWLTIAEDQENRRKVMTKLWTTLHGFMGSFMGKLFNTLFSKVEIRITQQTFLLKGEKFMLSYPCIKANIRAAPTAFRIPFPIPFNFSLPFLRERQVVAWYSRSQEGWPTVNMVMAGPSFPQLRPPLIESGELLPDINIPGFFVVTVEEVDAFYKQIAENAEPELRIVKTIEIPPHRKNTFKLIDHLYLFSDKDLAPPLTDFDALEKMHLAPNSLRLLRSEARYVRDLINDGESQLISELSKLVDE